MSRMTPAVMKWMVAALATLSLSTRAWAQAAGDTGARLDALTRLVEDQRRELAQLGAQVGTTPAPATCPDREMLARMIREELAKGDALRSAIPGGLDGLRFPGGNAGAGRPS